MNDKRGGQRSTQRQAREEAELRAGASTNQSTRHEEQSARKPSKIEPREWRGSGVCGDRHTD